MHETDGEIETGAECAGEADHRTGGFLSGRMK